MATRAKTGSRNGIEWRTTNDGVTRWRGVINLKATGKQRSSWFSTRGEAVAWRTKALGEAQAGTRGPQNPMTLREAWESFYASATNGGSSTRYKPGTLRTYEYGWKHVDPELGAHSVSAITFQDVQALVDRWAAAGVPAKTIRGRLDPVRVVYRGLKRRGLVSTNPTTDLELPAVDNARERYATKEEAAQLLTALPDADRAIWATAFYAGLRRGELLALQVGDVHFDHPQYGPHIFVRRSWDDKAGEIAPKSKAGTRRVAIGAHLKAILKADLKATGRKGSDLIFGRTPVNPFATSSVDRRAKKAWKNAGLAPIGLHECRHTFASWLIASGAEAKALSVVMGHADISETYNRYGKLMPGAEQAVGAALDVYLAAV